MKKSLSLLLAIAMIFGAFASVALAADPATTQEKFDFLKTKDIFKGVNDNGDAGLDQKMTRAQFARVLGLLDGLNVDAEPAKQDFTDVGPNHWAYQEVGAAFKAGLMVGIGGGKFNPNGNILVQDLAVAVSNVLGLKKVDGATVDGASAYAAPYIKALQDAGINLPTTYKEAATRALLVDAAYAVYAKINTPKAAEISKATQTDAKTIKLEFSNPAAADAKVVVKNGQTVVDGKLTFAADRKSAAFEAAANLAVGTYTAQIGNSDAVQVKNDFFQVTAVTQTGAKKIKIELSKAAAADAKVVVKNGFLPVDGKVTFADDRKSATFEADQAFVTQTLSVEVTGANAAEAKVQAPAVASISIETKNFQAIPGTQDVLYKAVNQFGEDIVVNPYDLTPSVYNITKNVAYTAIPDGTNKKFAISAGANIAKDDNILISLIHNASAKSAQKTIVVIPQSVVAKVELGSVAPLAGKSRITAGEAKLVIPVKLLDQYNNQLPVTKDNLAAVMFITSNGTVVQVNNNLDPAVPNANFGLVTVDGINQLQFTAQAVGTATVTAFVPATAAQSSTTVTVSAAPALKSVSLQQPSGLVVSGEKIEVPYTAVDTYGGATTLNNITDLVWFSNSAAVKQADITLDANKKIQITPSGSGVATINAYLYGALQGTIIVDVKAAATPAKVTGIKAGTLAQFTNGGAYTYKATDFTVIDQYNRVIADANLIGAFSVAKADATANKVTVAAGNVVTGTANQGEETLTATYAGQTFNFKVNTVGQSAVADYVVTKPANNTLLRSNNYTAATAGNYGTKVTITNGIDADGKKIAVTTDIDQMITSDAAAVAVDKATGTIYAVGTSDSKEAVVTVIKQGKIIAQLTFKTSNVAPVATAISFKSDVSKAITGAYDFGAQIVVTDQYGVDITGVTGLTWYSSDSSILAIDGTGKATIPATFHGEKNVTITAVTANAKVAALTVKVTQA